MTMIVSPGVPVCLIVMNVVNRWRHCYCEFVFDDNVKSTVTVFLLT